MTPATVPGSHIRVVAVFAFLLQRSTVNAVRRRLGRMREPRYLLGGLVGAVYLYWWLFRALLRGGARGGGGWSAALSPDARSLLLLGMAAGLAWMATVAWMFVSGPPRLSLGEAEVQFLAPAPLPRRALLHFVLLRSELGLLFTAMIMALVSGRRLQAQWLRSVAGLWVLLSTMHLHALGVSFWHAAWSERPPALRRTMKTVRVLAAAAIALVLASWLFEGARILIALAERGSLEPRSMTAALAPWAAGWVPRLLLWPFRAAAAPVLARDGATFVAALPAALGLLVLHYLWVVHINIRYEEAALEGARRHAERMDRLRRGKLAGPAPERRRLVVPFALRSRGVPEVAVLWKNLLSPRRTRLRTSVVAWLVAWTILLVSAAAMVGGHLVRGDLAVVIGTLGLGLAAAISALTLPLGQRNDFREDLEAAAVLRSWPLRPAGLAAAEIAAPLLACLLAIEGLLGGIVAVRLGVRIGLAWNAATRAATTASQWKSVPADWELGALLGLAVFLPALSAAVLVVHNAAVLAFPGWFPPGPRHRGLEASGTRLLGFLGIMLVLLLVLVPAVLVGAPVGYLGWRLVGGLCLLPAAVLGSVPVWMTVAVGLGLLGRLFQRFDVSVESWS
jgi:ABC-2 type transport system permease protein